jgi:sulfatase maturation enzyme AslB (radical SAM superfamily)
MTLPAIARPEAGPAAFHLLAKPTGAVCNLDCRYCFFLSKEMLYPGSRFRTADDLLETYLRQLIESHASAPEVTIAWQGGEPTLMGVEFFERSVELANSYLQPGQRAAYTIQTNATLLDEEWAQFFKEHDFLVGVSIDGPRARDTLPRYCRERDVRFACHGGCPKDRFIETPDGEPGLNYLCARLKAFFHHIDAPMRSMGALLTRNHAPAEIMATYAAGDARRGCNEPCTCNSGRKWNRCHGAEPALWEAA